MPPKFIELADRKGFVNTNRVSAIRHAPDRHGWQLFGHDDKPIGEAAEGFEPRDLWRSPGHWHKLSHDARAANA